MVYENSKQLLAEIRKQMDLQDILMKELAVKMGKSQQSIAQIFSISNPRCNTLFDICKSLGLQMDIRFINSEDE